MKGICALYKIETDLRLSHIIPKFAFDYLKKTGSKYLRTHKNPNIRLQDGTKLYLLGEKAEQEFSKRERWFANNIFFPYFKNERKEFVYDDNLAYFSISILWRVLLEQLSHEEIKDNPKLTFLSDVEEKWRLFLSEYVYPYQYDDLNIFFTDRVVSHTSEEINIDTYLTRTIDATIIVNNNYSKVTIYAKFLRFIVWCNVKGIDNKNQTTSINFSAGTLSTLQSISDTFFAGFIFNRIKELNGGPKVKDQEKIHQEIKRDEENFWASDSGQSILNDIRLNNQ